MRRQIDPSTTFGPRSVRALDVLQSEAKGRFEHCKWGHQTCSHWQSASTGAEPLRFTSFERDAAAATACLRAKRCPGLLEMQRRRRPQEARGLLLAQRCHGGPKSCCRTVCDKVDAPQDQSEKSAGLRLLLTPKANLRSTPIDPRTIFAVGRFRLTETNDMPT